MKQLSVVLSDDLNEWEVVSSGCHLTRTSIPQQICALFFSAGWHNIMFFSQCTVARMVPLWGNLLLILSS